jgi:hypothetical protein
MNRESAVFDRLLKTAPVGKLWGVPPLTMALTEDGHEKAQESQKNEGQKCRRGEPYDPPLPTSNQSSVSPPLEAEKRNTSDYSAINFTFFWLIGSTEPFGPMDAILLVPGTFTMIR